MVPAQAARLLRPAAGHQAQHDVRVQARALRGRDHRLRLTQRQRLRWSAFLTLWRSDERADVPPDEVASLGVADGPYEAVVGILHRSSCTRRRELLQGMPAVGGRQFSQLHRADKVSQRRYHLAPRADRFLRAIGQTVRQAVVNGLPHRVEPAVWRPLSSSLRSSRSLSRTSVLVRPETFRRFSACRLRSSRGRRHRCSAAKPHLNRWSPRHVRVERSHIEPNAMAPYLAPRAYARCGYKPSRPLTWRFRVELRGFEPLTPSMRTRCATGLRYSPWNARQRSKH